MHKRALGWHPLCTLSTHMHDYCVSVSIMCTIWYSSMSKMVLLPMLAYILACLGMAPLVHFINTYAQLWCLLQNILCITSYSNRGASYEAQSYLIGETKHRGPSHFVQPCKHESIVMSSFCLHVKVTWACGLPNIVVYNNLEITTYEVLHFSSLTSNNLITYNWS